MDAFTATGRTWPTVERGASSRASSRGSFAGVQLVRGRGATLFGDLCSLCNFAAGAEPVPVMCKDAGIALAIGTGSTPLSGAADCADSEDTFRKPISCGL